MAFIDDLKARPSFKNATTEEQLMAEIARLENSAAKVSALEGKVAELTAQIAESRKAAHTALLDQAVTEGKSPRLRSPHSSRFSIQMKRTPSPFSTLFRSARQASRLNSSSIGPEARNPTSFL